MNDGKGKTKQSKDKRKWRRRSWPRFQKVDVDFALFRVPRVTRLKPCKEQVTFRRITIRRSPGYFAGWFSSNPSTNILAILCWRCSCRVLRSKNRSDIYPRSTPYSASDGNAFRDHRSTTQNDVQWNQMKAKSVILLLVFVSYQCTQYLLSRQLRRCVGYWGSCITVWRPFIFFYCPTRYMHNVVRT